jgi:hypothetical protein
MSEPRDFPVTANRLLKVMSGLLTASILVQFFIAGSGCRSMQLSFSFEPRVSLLALLIAGCALVLSPAAAGDLSDFKSPLDNSPMTFPLQTGKDVVYPQALTDPGMFSIIYGGASGAMQSFFRRGMQQDQMLKIIAYVRTLDK